MKKSPLIFLLLLTLAAQGAVVINEVHPSPDINTELVKFIELYNDSDTETDLMGWKLTKSAEFTFTNSVLLGPGGYLVIAENPAALKAKFGVTAIGPWIGNTPAEGGKIALLDASGTLVNEVDYQGDFPWPTVGEAPGFSMELVNPAFDNSIGGNWRPSIGLPGGVSNGPTPGRRNAAFATNLPPAIRDVNHSPRQPFPGQPVRVSAKVTDPDGVQSVTLEYQFVNPGAYFSLGDAAYSANWTSVPMNDAYQDGDEQAGDGVYTATLPASAQINRRLVRYRIVATDAGGRSVRVPYAEDAQPNFAYFVYAGVPEWTGAIEYRSTNQGRANPVKYPTSVMRRQPAYHIITKEQSVLDSQFNEGGDSNEGYNWLGTFVYEDQVLDHVRYRARGGVWRHAMGKNAWKINFNRGHRFLARDNYGNSYNVKHDKLNFRPLIQQADYAHRGEQGMFESVSLRMFNMVGVPASRTHWFQLRVIDGATEYGPTQYDGDFWGLYLAVEEGDGDFLKEHDLPDGNFYMMGEGLGEKQNQGRYSSLDDTDLVSFVDGYFNSPNTSWWRTNLDLNSYYSYRTIIEAIHHYDVDDPPGKNYQYYHNPATGRWSVHPWDLDLTWAKNMYGQGNEPFKSRIAANAGEPQLQTEYWNRVREIRDLLFNTDQMFQLIDEYFNQVRGPEPLSIVDADRAQWDYNPIMTNQNYGVLASKAGVGRFYLFPREQPGISNSIYGAAQLMKNYVVTRADFLDTLSFDDQIPSRPSIKSASSTNYPINDLRFSCSKYSGTRSFAAIKWRMGEITPTNAPGFDPYRPRKYEIESAWESGEITPFQAGITVGAGQVKVGHTYRARAKMKDVTGRWSRWSEPVEFTVGPPDNVASFTSHLRLTELMYNPPAGSDYEFIELHNTSMDEPLNLGGVTFTQGIDYTFPTNTLLPPGGFLVLTRSSDVAAFRTHYKLEDNVALFGPYLGSLNNDGEVVRLKTSSGGSEIFSFQYGDGRGWPLAADGAGHSLVPRERAVIGESQGSLNYGGNWRASSYIGGSPGFADPEPPDGVLINEIAAQTTYSDGAHPEYESNDWIELFNPNSTPVPLSGYYLSDSAGELRKWALPAVGVGPRSWASFDEVTGFHNPITNGFGLSGAGEKVFLSYLPGNGLDRVVDAVTFKAQEEGFTIGRVPDGGEFFASSLPTRNTPNRAAEPGPVISELMYHPVPTAANPEDNTADEYVEIFNPLPVGVNLFNSEGAWRIDGGIKYVFSTNASLAPTQAVLLVSFDPTNTTLLRAFRKVIGFSNIVTVWGPYSGKLGNESDRVAMEKPRASPVAGSPPDWVVVDEAVYGAVEPWDSTAAGEALSLSRKSIRAIGNDSANWLATTRTPGIFSEAPIAGDGDHDGMPDDWELSHGFNPHDASDAGQDSDADGLTNLQEYLAGTDPRDFASRLKLRFEPGLSGQMTFSFSRFSGRAYRIERSLSLPAGGWTLLKRFDAENTDAQQTLDVSTSGGGAFYRLVLEQP